MFSQLTFLRRTELSLRLKAILRDVGGPSFGPEIPGCLLKFKYSKEEEVRDQVLELDLERVMASEELRALFGVSSKEDEKRFLTLVYLEGRKYTFGETYEGRRSQGDFVRLWLDFGGLWWRFGLWSLEENYFSLDCKDGGLWICVQKGFPPPSFLVSINGVPLWSEWDLTFDLQRPFQCKLEFGDIITVSTRDDRKPMVDFLFKASVVKVQTMAEAGTKEVHQGPAHLINPLILENVLQFLPTTVVEGLRSVSQDWNTEGLKALRNRLAIRIFDLSKCDFHSDSHSDSADDWLRISDYVQSQLNFPAWKITLSLRPHWDTDPKIVDDLRLLLLDGPFHYVTSLSLSCNVDEDKDVPMLELILGTLRFTLRSLHLELYSYDGEAVPSLHPLENLQTLSLSILSTKDVFLFLQGLLPAMRHIQTLSLPDGYPFSGMHSITILGEIAKIQSSSEGGFGGLEHIGIGATVDYELERLASLRAGSLKTLELGERYQWCRQTLHSLNRCLRPALERHSDSIQKLTIHFSPCGYRDVDATLAIKLPWRLSNLRSLSVFVFLHTHYSTNYRCTFGFDDIDYNRRFPNLSKLTVWPVDTEHFSSGSEVVKSLDRTPWRRFLPALNAFIQPNSLDEGGNIASVRVPSVRSVDIPFVLMGKYHRVLDGLEATFPNVDWPPELATARQAPVETDE